MLGCLLGLPGLGWGQEVKLQGEVFSAEEGDPIFFATVVLMSEGRQAIGRDALQLAFGLTDEKGQLELRFATFAFIPLVTGVSTSMPLTARRVRLTCPTSASTSG